MKIATIVGARPQFIKAALVSKAFKGGGIKEVLINTGQHYDYNMSKQFFLDLKMSDPAYDLGVGSMFPVEQTAAIMQKLAPVFARERPDMVLVYGDTNSTLAGAVTAARMKIPIAHVEAGLRSYDMCMPEEVNRVITDRLSTVLFCPTKGSVENLEKEGITQGVHEVGDIMYELAMEMAAVAEKRSKVLAEHGLEPGRYILATIHREANTDSAARLTSIVRGLCGIKGTVVLPLHPRTRKMLKKFSLDGKLERARNIRILDPVGYLDMISLEKSAKRVITDSGGVQKEAYFFKVPCITLRPGTEWTETLENGWNRLVDVDFRRIISEADARPPRGRYVNHYGDGKTADKIVKIMKSRAQGARPGRAQAKPSPAAAKGKRPRQNGRI